MSEVEEPESEPAAGYQLKELPVVWPDDPVGPAVLDLDDLDRIIEIVHKHTGVRPTLETKHGIAATPADLCKASDAELATVRIVMFLQHESRLRVHLARTGGSSVQTKPGFDALRGELVRFIRLRRSVRPVWGRGIVWGSATAGAAAATIVLKPDGETPWITLARFGLHFVTAALLTVLAMWFVPKLGGFVTFDLSRKQERRDLRRSSKFGNTTAVILIVLAVLTIAATLIAGWWARPS